MWVKVSHGEKMLFVCFEEDEDEEEEEEERRRELSLALASVRVGPR